jgi:hypothetical protein
MARPPAYERDYSFSDFETNNPGQPKPGAALDTEFDDVSVALTGTQDALALIQRDDGALANESVGEDQLVAGVFDGVVDAITADAQAAAVVATDAAAAANTHANTANTAANAALTAQATAEGAAALAGASQAIAQTAANDADVSAQAADDSAMDAALAANDTAGSVAAVQSSVDLAFKWAEYLAAPVGPSPPGYPEAVDDGMWSSKWWALRARDYMTVTHLELGSGQADIGQAYLEWLAIPGNVPPLGLVYAQWGAPPLEYALTEPAFPDLAASWTLITGGVGPAPNLTIGTVVSGAFPAVVISGTNPNYVLNFTLETGPQGIQGIQGIQGVPGPANTLSIGTVTTGAPGSAADATITGFPPNQTLSLSIPEGIQGTQGIQGIQGIQGVPGTPAGAPANPTALVGIVSVPGVAATVMRSDGAPALSQAIVPTWTGAHTFSAASVFNAQVSVNADVRSRGQARFLGWIGTLGGADLLGPAVEVGVTAGAGTITAYDRTAVAYKPLQLAGTTVTLQTAGSGDRIVIDDAYVTIKNGNSMLLRLQRDDALMAFYNGAGTLRYGYIQGGSTLTPFLRFAVEAGVLEFWTNNIRRVTIAGQGATDQVLKIQGSNNVTYFCYGLNEDTYIRPGKDEGQIYIGDAGTAARVNIPAPCFFSTTSLLRTLGLANHANDQFIAFNNILSRGSCFVQGVVGGYAGLCVYDQGGGGGLQMMLMSNGLAAGVYITADSKWLILRNDASNANCYYNLSGPAFTVTSSRTIKRETGKPMRAADILSRLRPILYRLLADESNEQLGMVAEEVHDICPQLSNGKTISYDRLAVLLLADWQESRGIAL